MNIKEKGREEGRKRSDAKWQGVVLEKEAEIAKLREQLNLK